MIEPLVFRRPSSVDLCHVFSVHADPRTNVFNPAGPDDEEASRARLAEWRDHWQRYGFGYEVIEDRTGAVLGMAGVRHERWLQLPVLNLYYRLTPEAWGRGIATAAGQRALETAARMAPDLPVLARTRRRNLPSQRTAAKIGLQRRSDLEVDDENGPVIVYANC
jgi:ribosomal-protein-alanine N-acetyltransferase